MNKKQLLDEFSKEFKHSQFIDHSRQKDWLSKAIDSYTPEKKIIGFTNKGGSTKARYDK